MTRLGKRDAERLLADYAGADPVGALRRALGRVLDRPDDTWPGLLAAAGLTETRRAALLAGDDGALDDLARELNELRDLPGAAG